MADGVTVLATLLGDSPFTVLVDGDPSHQIYAVCDPALTTDIGTALLGGYVRVRLEDRSPHLPMIVGIEENS